MKGRRKKVIKMPLKKETNRKEGKEKEKALLEFSHFIRICWGWFNHIPDHTLNLRVFANTKGG